MSESSRSWIGKRVAQWRPDRELWVHAAIVALLGGASLFVASSSVWFAQYFVVKSDAFVPLRTIDDGMFRWDSVYYHSIATEGYAYDGDPCRPQNVVFLPAFPLLVRAVSAALAMDVQPAGFLVVRCALFVGVFLLFRWVHAEQGLSAAVFVTLGVLFSPGSFAFHAWYSESCMLLFLALALLLYRRGAYLGMGCAAFALGATRVTVLPFVLLMALACLRRAWREARSRPADTLGAVRRVAGDVLAAALCVGGFGGWLALLWVRFGDPFALISAIKYCAWSKVHLPIGVLEWVTLRPLFGHALEALERTTHWVLDIRTTNLIWTLLAAGATAWALVRRRGDLVSLGFLGYFALTFYANGKSAWLESSARYYVPMFTIYLAAHGLWSWARQRGPERVVDAAFGALFAVQVMYMIFHQILFTVQRGHYF